LAAFRLNKYVKKAFAKDSESNVIISIGAFDDFILNLRTAVRVYRYSVLFYNLE